MFQTILSALPSLMIGAAGGFLFHLLHLPLPWTLGAIAASALAAVTLNRWRLPARVRVWARPVVGVLAGSGFAPGVIESIASWWPALLIVAGYSLVISAIGYVVFRRWLGFDVPTAYFAATPGGLAELSLLGGSLGADTKMLVLIHAVRVITVVVFVSLLAQFMGGTQAGSPSGPVGGGHHSPEEWAILVACGVLGLLVARRLRLPGGPLIIPMFFSAVVHATGLTDAAPPYWIVAFAQVLIGSIVGSRFAGITLIQIRQGLLVAGLWAGFMVTTAALVGIAGAWLLGMPFTWLLLALAPGGAAEMLVITYALGADVAFVALCQVARINLVLACAPLFFRHVAPDAVESDRDPS